MADLKPRQPRYAQIYADKPDMAETAARVWQETISYLLEGEIINARRVEIADRYARACAEYESLYPDAAKEGPVLIGPNGGQLFNFAWSAVEKLNDRMAKFEDALLISPKAANAQAVEKPSAPPSKTAADAYLD